MNDDKNILSLTIMCGATRTNLSGYICIYIYIFIYLFYMMVVERDERNML